MRKIIYKKVWDAIDFLAVTMQSQMPGTFNDLIIWNLRLSFQFPNLWTFSIRDNGEKKKEWSFQIPFPLTSEEIFPLPYAHWKRLTLLWSFKNPLLQLLYGKWRCPRNPLLNLCQWLCAFSSYTMSELKHGLLFFHKTWTYLCNVKACRFSCKILELSSNMILVLLPILILISD